VQNQRRYCDWLYKELTDILPRSSGNDPYAAWYSITVQALKENAGYALTFMYGQRKQDTWMFLVVFFFCSDMVNRCCSCSMQFIRNINGNLKDFITRMWLFGHYNCANMYMYCFVCYDCRPHPPLNYWSSRAHQLRLMKEVAGTLGIKKMEQWYVRVFFSHNVQLELM
jgi:hypothetical protein